MKILRMLSWLLLLSLLPGTAAHADDPSTPATPSAPAWTHTFTLAGESLPSEDCISAGQAALAAAESLVHLGLETPESLGLYDTAILTFRPDEDAVPSAWTIHLIRNARESSTIRIHAGTGQTLALFSFEGAFIMPAVPEENAAADAVIAHWDALYAQSPEYAPEVNRSEIEDSPLPGPEQMSQRIALQHAVRLASLLTGQAPDALTACRPYVTFDVTPMAAGWDILFFSPEDNAPFRSFSCSINAETGALETLKWQP